MKREKQGKCSVCDNLATIRAQVTERGYTAIACGDCFRLVDWFSTKMKLPELIELAQTRLKTLSGSDNR